MFRVKTLRQKKTAHGTQCDCVRVAALPVRIRYWIHPVQTVYAVRNLDKSNKRATDSVGNVSLLFNELARFENVHCPHDESKRSAMAEISHGVGATRRLIDTLGAAAEKMSQSFHTP